MGFDFDMVLRVAKLYPRDANACIECLLSGGVPEDTEPPPPAVAPSSGGDKFFNADDYADISTANGTKRRRYDPNADQSLVTSRALVVVPQPGDSSATPASSTSSTASAAAAAATTTTSAAPVRRSTAADVLFELQSLFATLQMSQSGAISTRALTDSFGWRSSQAVQQQDVHELNRMLFDVIERALRRTPQAKLVQQLYGGATTTSLRCEVCNTERRRADGLLDLPLSLRDAQTVHAALAIACGSERLTESNRLTCDVCNARQDTTRSVRLGRFSSTPLSNQAPPPPSDAEPADDAAAPVEQAPALDVVVDVPPLLWLPLARFDYDLERGQRVKLTTPFLFPLELDLAPYVVGSTSQANAALEQYVAMTPSKPTALERIAYLTRRSEQPSHYRYVLAAVVLHSGGPFGGHYHALAREPTGAAANVWHDFNDSRVTPLGRTEPMHCEAYFAWRAAQEKPESPELDSLPDELRGTHRALQALIDAVGGSESAYMLLYRRELVNAGGELTDPPLAHIDRPPSPLLRRLEEENVVREAERAVKLIERNRMELDVCVPQWLRVLDDGSVVGGEPNPKGEGEDLVPSPPDSAPHNINDMRIKQLAVDADGRTTRVRVTCDRRVLLALLSERLQTFLCSPPTAAGATALKLAPLRFRGEVAVVAERPVVTVVGEGAPLGQTVVSTGIAGKSVRMLLWNGSLMRDNVAYTGPAVNVELMWLGDDAAAIDANDGLPVRSATTLVTRETATLTSVLLAAVHRCAEALPADGARFLLSTLNTQRATVLLEATMCARDSPDSVDGWCKFRPEVAATRTLLDTDVGDGTQLVLERVAPDALPSRTTAADRFATARRSKIRLFVVDGRGGRPDGAVVSIYCSRGDTVAVAKQRAIDALLASGAALSDAEHAALLQHARLRRVGTATAAAAMGDLAALMWLREESRQLTHYAVEDSTRVLLEDISWLEDDSGAAAAGASEPSALAVVEEAEANEGGGNGAVRLNLRVSQRLKERLAAMTPPLNADALTRDPLVVPRNCEINVLLEKIARRFGNMPIKGQLTSAAGTSEEVWALHARTINLFERPAQLLAVDKGHTLRNYNIFTNDPIFVDVGAARTGVAVLSLSFWCAAWQMTTVSNSATVAPATMSAATSATTSTATSAAATTATPPPASLSTDPTALDAAIAASLAEENSAVAKSTRADAELAAAIASEAALVGGSVEDAVKFSDRPERRLVTPLQLVSSRYTSGVDAASDHSSVDQLPELEVAVDATLAEVRDAVMKFDAFRAVLRQVIDDADVSKFTLRLWLKSRLLRGASPTLRSMRVKESDTLTVQLVPVGTPDTLDIDGDEDALTKTAPPPLTLEEALADVPEPPVAAVAPPPPAPLAPPPNAAPVAKRYLPLLLVVYRRDSANRTYHRRPIEITFRGKGVARLCDAVAEAMQDVEPGVKGAELLLAKYLLSNCAFTTMTDNAEATPSDTDSKQLEKKKPKAPAGKIDRIRAQPYHLRDGDVLVVYRKSDAQRDDFVGENKVGSQGRKRRAGDDPDFFARDRTRRDDSAALEFDIDFGDN